MEKTPLYAPGFHVPGETMARLADLRGAIDSRRLVWMDYGDREGARTERYIRPLGLFFWGTTWSLSAWCELRNDFRDFRLDRIIELRVQESQFVDEPGRTLADFFRARELE